MRALVLVDLQNDFMPGGPLGVSGGDETVPLANALMARVDLVVATQDWHPAGHASFASRHPGRAPGDVVDLDGLRQTLWPDHCVQDTPGAAFHPALDTAAVAHVVRKGTDPRVDSYSGFFDNGQRRATGLDAYLRERGVRAVFVCGLATDYCVRFTVLDALALGYETRVVVDACRAVDLTAGDGTRALAAMRAAGATLVAGADV
jgi:nicotinamidase/pyrazinamidase